MTELSLATPKSAAEPGRLRRLFRWLAGDLRAALAILVLLVLVIVAIGAPWIAPYAPTAQDANNMLAAPGPGHLLGTDDLGRDIFSRLVYGAPATVYLAIPGARGGVGKVTLTLQGRTVEYEAVTAGARIPTGAPVVVVDVVAPGTLEVTPTPEVGV